MRPISLKELSNSLTNEQLLKIQDFLISEIDKANLAETIDFVRANKNRQENFFADMLYDGQKYSGIYLDGNQYLIASDQKNVQIIDAVSEAHGVAEASTRLCLTLENFVYLITNKQIVLEEIQKRLPKI